MDIRIDSKAVRQMANRIRSAVGSDAVSHSKSLEIAAQALGYANWDTLSGLLKQETKAQFVVTEPVQLFIDAFSCDEWSSGPSWAKVTLDQALIDNLLEMQALCHSKGIDEVSRSIDADEWDESEELNIRDDELIVGRTSWWFHANPKHCSYAVETRSIYIDDLLKALSTKESGAGLAWRNGVLFYDPSENTQGFMEMLVKAGQLDETFATT